MSGYEFMFILDPTLDDAASLSRVVEQVEGHPESAGRPDRQSDEPRERRRLAYPIAGHHEGLYMLCYFDAPPDASGIERRVRLGGGRAPVHRRSHAQRETRERDQAADLRRREERAARACGGRRRGRGPRPRRPPAPNPKRRHLPKGRRLQKLTPARRTRLSSRGGVLMTDKSPNTRRRRRSGGRRIRVNPILNSVDRVDWKDVDFLREFLGDRSKISRRGAFRGPTHRTQRQIRVAHQRARQMALLPYA